MAWQPGYGPAWLDRGRVRFRVWSPGTERAELVLDGRRIAMRRRPSGDHEVTVAGVSPGTRYQVALDGDGPFPDPWSRWQPDGVHGPSALLAPARRPPAHRPVPRGVCQATYELHVGTFTPEGTYAAASRRLPALRRLGIDTIQVMPVAAFAGERNWGYDGVCFYAPARAYGTPEDLVRFVAAAHRTGLAVILDAVYNHLGPDGAYMHRFAPEFFDEATRTPWGGAIAYARPPVRRTVADAARWWIERYGFDGLRLDAVHAIFDRTSPHVVAEIGRAARRAYRRAYVVAEDERNERALVADHRLDAVISDDFHHSVRVTLTRERDSYFSHYSGGADAIARTIAAGWLFEGRRGEHKGTPAAGLGAESFVFHLENHDQVGNRALALHLAGLVDTAAYRAASALLLLVPERAMLFQGQEWATGGHFYYFTDHARELGRLVTEGRRREFEQFPEFRDHPERIPDPQALDTFLGSKLDWAESRTPSGAATLRLYRELLRLRRSDAVLRRPDLAAMRAWAEGEILHVERRTPHGCRELVVRLRPGPLAAPAGRVLLHTEDRRFAGRGRKAQEGPAAILVAA